jgi:hypothetical protein
VLTDKYKDRLVCQQMSQVYTWIAFVEKLEQLAAQPSEYSEAFGAQLEALRLMNATDLMHFDDAMFVACFTELPGAVSQWAIRV